MSISKIALAAVVALGTLTVAAPADAHYWGWHHRPVVVERVAPRYNYAWLPGVARVGHRWVWHRGYHRRWW